MLSHRTVELNMNLGYSINVFSMAESKIFYLLSSLIMLDWSSMLFYRGNREP